MGRFRAFDEACAARPGGRGARRRGPRRCRAGDDPAHPRRPARDDGRALRRGRGGHGRVLPRRGPRPRRAGRAAGRACRRTTCRSRRSSTSPTDATGQPDVTDVLAAHRARGVGPAGGPAPRAVPPRRPRRGRDGRRRRGGRPTVAAGRRARTTRRRGCSPPPGAACSTGCGPRRPRDAARPTSPRETGHRQDGARTMADPGGLVEDDLLRLVLMCAHPALAPEAASALTLRLVLGVPTADVARLFLVPEATMAARITRAKKKIVGAGDPVRRPRTPACCRSGSTPSPRSPTSRSRPATRPAPAPTCCAPRRPARRSGWCGSCSACDPTSRCSSPCWR